MRPYPAVNVNKFPAYFLIAALLFGISPALAATTTPEGVETDVTRQIEAAMAAAQKAQAAQEKQSSKEEVSEEEESEDDQLKKLQALMAGREEAPEDEPMTQADLDKALKNPDSPEYKADQLAKKAKKDISLFGMAASHEEEEERLTDEPTPPEMEYLQDVHKTHGTDYSISDDPISEQLSIDMRRDAQREAALSYGARGGLSKRAYQIMERMTDYEQVLDGVFDFRQLLIKAPSGMLIEPPIVKESLDALIINSTGNEAAVADQVLKINKQAKIVSAPRDWRQYLILAYETDIPPPPKVLWPKSKEEQAEWNAWVRQGWDAGYQQGEDMFDSGVNTLVADYSGMVRYKMLLAQGKISQPFALQEDRGVTGGGDEMRVGDRALRITGPSQFLTGADLWKPADR
jgi:defect-in-organelle-trafficking protein DotC